MTAPPPQQPAAFYSPQPWTLARLLYLIAAVCMFLAVLVTIHVIHGTPALAWVFGGLCAWLLSGAI